MHIERKLADMGLKLPPPIKAPPGVVLPFSFVRLHQGIAYISGHGPQDADGAVAGPFGKVGVEVSVEQGYEAGEVGCAVDARQPKTRAWRSGSGGRLAAAARPWSIARPISRSSRPSSMALPI